MSNDQDKINELLSKLEILLKKQEVFSNEIKALQDDLNQLQQSQKAKPTSTESFSAQTEAIPENLSSEKVSDETDRIQDKTDTPKKLTRDSSRKILGGVCAGIAEYFGVNLFLIRTICIILSLVFCVGALIYLLLWIFIPQGKTMHIYNKNKSATITPQVSQKSSLPPPNKKISKTNWEKFIGENLINKIGIIIIIIGVAIGTKYTLDNDLLSPLSRIILGYLVGAGLLGFGIWLKKTYENFSAVLVSGAITILYFITYTAYSFYDLFPQLTAFIFMVLFTMFAVIAAFNYNKQIIAHIGLVGAYAVPFLLSDNTGNAAVLFSYISIINIGILVIAFKKYWKALYVSSFVITWLIFASWFTGAYSVDEHFRMALVFNLVFFILFYITFLAFKLLQKEQFEISDILLLLANSFVFYGLGYSIVDSYDIGTQLLGTFTLANALLHFIVSVIIYKQKLGDRNLFYLVSGLVLVFVTIAIPVQLDGNWVTLLWVGEAALLFWIGRTKHVAVYEYLSYALMILAVLSIYQDWYIGYTKYNAIETITKPILNSHFLTSALFICGFGFIYKLHTNQNYQSPIKTEWLKLLSFLIPAVLISSIYIAFRLELEHYWQLLFNDSRIAMADYENYNNLDLLKFKTIWVINYSLLFVAVLSFINMRIIKNKLLGLINLGLNICALVVFLVQGLYVLSELRVSYLEQSLSEYYDIGIFNIGIRYVSLVFVILTILACYKYLKQEFMKTDFRVGFDLLLYTTVLWIISSELIHWLDMANSTDSYKLGLSILWGLYALLLISIGIWKSKKHLRVGAIVIFSITLIKLFFYDISHLNTISKTIVFLSLGVLLLIISFLYNKFKHKIADESES